LNNTNTPRLTPKENVETCGMNFEFNKVEFLSKGFSLKSIEIIDFE